MIARTRTALVALFAALMVLRWSLSQPVSAVTARIAEDPWEAVRSAGDGWTFAGTLGGGTVEGIRELPYALAVALGTDAGLSAHAVETCWRILVVVLAVLGAVQLGRGLAPTLVADDGPQQSWAPWAGALFFAAGTVVLATIVRSPVDGLAAATLPWVVAPLLLRDHGWRSAALSATWVGVAGFGAAGWAVAAFVAGFAAALPRHGGGLRGTLRWLMFAAAASAWWVVLLAWEARNVVDVSALSAGTLRAEAATSFDRPDLGLLVLVAVVGSPFVVALGALVMRSPHLERLFIVVLMSAVTIAALLSWFGDGLLPVSLPVAGDTAAGWAAPLLGLVALAGLVAWCPWLSDLCERLAPMRERRRPESKHEVAALVAALLLATTVFAGMAATIAEPPPIPADEEQLLDAVAEWSADAPPGRALVLPVDSGSTHLTAIGTALGTRPWLGRDAVPTSGVGGTIAIDDVVARLGRGDAGPGTASALRRLGVSYVLVRLGGSVIEDLQRPTGLVRSALDALGAERIAVLRATDAVAASSDPLVDFGVRTATPQIEVWAPPATADGWVYSGSPIGVVGDAGTVSDLADAGALHDRAIRLRPGSDDKAVVVSDSARRRDIDQRVATDPYGPDLAAEEPRLLVPDDAAPVTSAVTRLKGAEAVSASSTGADVSGFGRDPGTAPSAAIDGNGFTSWRSAPGAGVGQWWQVEFAEPTPVAGTEVRMLRNAFTQVSPDQVRVSADGRDTAYSVDDDGMFTVGEVGTVRRLRFTVTSITGNLSPSDSVGIVEVALPGIGVSNPVLLDDTPTSGWLMALRPGSSARCVPTVPRGTDDEAGPGTACSDGLFVSGPDASPLRRVVTAPERTPVVGRVWAVAMATKEAAALADRIGRPSVVASSGSAGSVDLRTRPQAAADGDLSTAWRPSTLVQEPELTLAWTGFADVTGIRLVPPDGDEGSRPTRVRVSAKVTGRRTGLPGPDLAVEIDVAADGMIDLPRVHTRKLTITILDDTDVPSFDSTTGSVKPMPVAVGEVELEGGPVVSYDTARSKHVDCEDGPTVTIDGVESALSLDVTSRQIVNGSSVLATVCGRPELDEGDNDVVLPSTLVWQPRGLLLAAAGADLFDDATTAYSDPGPAAVSLDVLSVGRYADPVGLDLGADERVRTLVLPLTASAGWRATIDGKPLDRVTIDGWAQGWEVPAGSGKVSVRYSSGSDLSRTVLAASVGWAVVAVLLSVLGVASVFSAFRRPGKLR